MPKQDRPINTPPTREHSDFIAEMASANFRVFIAGKEVTSDVNSLKIQYHDGNQTSMAQISLNNEFDKYTITPDEMAGLAGVTEKLSLVVEEEVNNLRNPPPLVEGVAVEVDRTDFPGPEGQLSAERINEIARERFFEVAEENVSSQFSDIFPGKINRLKREMMERKFYRGTFINNDKFIFLDDLKRSSEKGNTPQGLFPRLSGWVPQYQIYSGSTIFHTSDVIRIFLQDPYDPYVWYYGFTGYITDDSDILDVNNDKSVDFTCEDILRPFKYARTTVNPQIANPEVLTLFNDTAIYGGLKEPFKNLSIPESIMFQVFGGKPLGITNEELGIEVRRGDNLQGEPLEYFDGTGNFDFKNSRIFIFGEELQQADAGSRKFYQNIENKVERDIGLRSYQAFVDTRVRVEDLVVEREEESQESRVKKTNIFSDIVSNSVSEGFTGSGALTLPVQRSPIYRTITAIGENLDLYPIDGRVIMILPGSLNPTTNTDVLTNEFASYSVTKTNFTSRFNMLKMYAERLDFSLFATPRGDLLFEMPFYDFFPDDFGVDPTLPPGTNRHLYTEKRPPERLNEWPELKGPAPNLVVSSGTSENELPSYAHAFTLARNNQISTYSRTFSDANIRTIFTTGFFIVQGFPNVGESRNLLGKSVAAVAESLVPSFGSRHEAINPHGYISSEKGAQLFAEVQLNKQNSSATNVNIGIDAKFDLFLNRPIRILHKEILATLRSYTHEINVKGRNLSTSSLEMNCTRFWTGGVVGDKNIKSVDGSPRRIYEPIGTQASKPLDYRTLFDIQKLTEEEIAAAKKRATARKPKEE